MTASGQLMGTPEFLAPEQAAGLVREIDARTDLYAVGALMFTLTTGETVHLGRTPMERVVFAATKPARSLFDVWPDAPPGFANVVDVGLSFDKAQRWANASAMRRAVTRVIETLPPDAMAPSAVTTAKGTGTLILGKADAGSERPQSDPPIPLARRHRKP